MTQKRELITQAPIEESTLKEKIPTHFVDEWLQILSRSSNLQSANDHAFKDPYPCLGVILHSYVGCSFLGMVIYFKNVGMTLFMSCGFGHFHVFSLHCVILCLFP